MHEPQRKMQREPRRPYTPPAMIEYGNILNLTRGPS